MLRNTPAAGTATRMVSGSAGCTTTAAAGRSFRGSETRWAQDLPPSSDRARQKRGISLAQAASFTLHALLPKAAYTREGRDGETASASMPVLYQPFFAS